MGQADPLQPARRHVVRGRVAVARDVDEVAVGVPAVDDLDRARVGHAREDDRLAVGLGDADGELVLAQAGDPVGRLDLVGQRDAEAPAGGLGEDVPVVVEGRVDVEGDPHGRRGRGTAAADYAGGTMTTASPPRRRPVDLDAYGPQGRSPWLDVDWRAHQRWVEVGGRGGQRHRPRLAGRPSSSSTASPGPGRTGSSSCRCWPRTTASSRWTCPGSASRRCRREKISIPGYGRLVEGVLGALGLDAVALVGNSMGGFIAAEVAIQFPARVERLVLVSAAGPVDRVPAERARPPRPAARRAAADGLGRLARVALGHAGPAPAHAACAAGDRREAPRALPRAPVRGAAARQRHAGLRRRARRADGLPDPRAAAGDRLPDAHRLGRGRPPGPRARRLRVRAPDPEGAEGRLPRHRAHRDARAPRGVQRPARGLPARGRGRGRRPAWPRHPRPRAVRARGAGTGGGSGRLAPGRSRTRRQRRRPATR